LMLAGWGRRAGEGSTRTERELVVHPIGEKTTINKRE
jgi:hypothetical protein